MVNPTNADMHLCSSLWGGCPWQLQDFSKRRPLLALHCRFSTKFSSKFLLFVRKWNSVDCWTALCSSYVPCLPQSLSTVSCLASCTTPCTVSCTARCTVICTAPRLLHDLTLQMSRMKYRQKPHHHISPKTVLLFSFQAPSAKIHMASPPRRHDSETEIHILQYYFPCPDPFQAGNKLGLSGENRNWGSAWPRGHVDWGK